MEEYISGEINHPEHLFENNRNYYFTHKIDLCKAVSNNDLHDKSLWKGLKKFNSLRNSYAHSLEPNEEQINTNIKKFVDFIKSSGLYKNIQIIASEFRTAVLNLLLFLYSVVRYSASE